VTSIPSLITGIEFRSKACSVGPCISWEKIRVALVGPSKAGFLGLGHPVSCSFFHSGSWRSSSLGLLPLSSFEEAMVLPTLKINS
jgi:hypothetical protein